MTNFHETLYKHDTNQVHFTCVILELKSYQVSDYVNVLGWVTRHNAIFKNFM